MISCLISKGVSCVGGFSVYVIVSTQVGECGQMLHEVTELFEAVF